ncbi:MAG: hypothetical protein IJH65_16845 [Methanobrevibacter sp.]|nr:hypothetical protein [Methanobrevibacter sp.]
MENKHLIIALLIIIIVLLAGILVLMPNMKQNETIETTDNKTTNQTTVEQAPDSITVELPQFDTRYTKTAGEYTVEAEKWMGGSVGGFEVHLYKNGNPVNKDSYLSRAYFCMDGEWKWSEWGNGEDGYEGYHRYPVSNGVEIQEIEVKF